MKKKKLKSYLYPILRELLYRKGLEFGNLKNLKV